MQRLPAVAGQFYPDQSDSLRETVNDLLASAQEKHPAIGLIAPHAGYLYSGAIAGQTFARVAMPRRVVILGPNHHGYGHPAAVYASGTWVSPLGTTAVDSELAASILKGCPALASDETAHRYEHSLEVLLPFIQVLAPEAAIVPICLGRLSLDELLSLGEALGKVLAASGEEALLVASSDMTHYESGDIARQKDMLALQRVLELDPAGLYRTVAAQKITMCGVIPVTVMLAAARHLGARKATLVQYGNSGDVIGDQSQVVGYAGVILERG
jgi:hypothetical protein